MKNCTKEVIDIIKKFHYEGKSGIVYCLSRRECEDVATELCTHKFSAKPYHAELENRSQIQLEWSEGKVKIVCATIGLYTFLCRPINN